MSRVRGKDTQPELTVRRYLYANGVRYRLHANLPGKPDIVIGKKKVAIFVNGCFWHAHGCSRSKLPQTHHNFWKSKIEGNAARDLKNYSALVADGWEVLIVWECSITQKVTEGTALKNVLLACGR